MAQGGTEVHDVIDDAELTRRAQSGEEAAFDELYRRHAASAWNLAWATSSGAAAARRATIEAFARSFTALRAGRADGVAFPTLVRNQVLNIAVDDGGEPAAVAGNANDGAVVESLRALPVTLRTAGWLREVERLPEPEVAAVVGLDPTGTSSLVDRARTAWRARYLQHHFASSGNRNCSRAVGRMRALGAGSLGAADRDALDRHLRLCEPCDERMTTSDSLASAAASALPAVPVLLVDDVRAAWAAAVTTPTRRGGLSPRTEKVLAGATAAVAALGLVGAAIVGTGRTSADATEATTRAAAPVGTDVSTPVPLHLPTAAELSAPKPRPLTTPSDDSMSVEPLSSTDTGAVPLAPENDDGPAAPAPADPGPDDPAGDDDGSIPNEGPGDDDTPAIPEAAVPTAAVSVTVADVPVAVAVDEDPGATVGPVSVGSTPEPAPSEEPAITVGGPLAPAQPVVDEVVAGL